MKTLVLLALVAAVAVGVVINSQAGIGCGLCETFVKELEKELKHGEGTLEQKANRVCNRICKGHHFLDAMCKEIIDKSLEEVVHLIEAHEPPSKVCRQIHMC